MAACKRGFECVLARASAKPPSTSTEHSRGGCRLTGFHWITCPLSVETLIHLTYFSPVVFVIRARNCVHFHQSESWCSILLYWPSSIPFISSAWSAKLIKWFSKCKTSKVRVKRRCTYWSAPWRGTAREGWGVYLTEQQCGWGWNGSNASFRHSPSSPRVHRWAEMMPDCEASVSAGTGGTAGDCAGALFTFYLCWQALCQTRAVLRSTSWGRRSLAAVSVLEWAGWPAGWPCSPLRSVWKGSSLFLENAEQGQDLREWNRPRFRRA